MPGGVEGCRCHVVLWAGSQELGREGAGLWPVLAELDSLWCPNLSLLGHAIPSLSVTVAQPFPWSCFPQVVLINAVKDVAKALGDLIGATKAAAGKAGDDPAVYQLKNSAKVCAGCDGKEQMRQWGWRKRRVFFCLSGHRSTTGGQSGQKGRKGHVKGGTQHAEKQLRQCEWSMGMGQFWTNPQGNDRCGQQARACVGIHLAVFPQVMVTNVTSLLKTVKAVEDEATKGTRALEATIEHIGQELAVSVAAVLPLPHRLPTAPCLTAASRLAGLLLPCASCQGLHPRGLHPYDERHHDGHSQSGGRWQLMPAGGCHRHGQPEPPGHCGHAALLQGGAGGGCGSLAWVCGWRQGWCWM